MIETRHSSTKKGNTKSRRQKKKAAAQSADRKWSFTCVLMVLSVFLDRDQFI